MEAKRRNTAEVSKDDFCTACGWPIIFACCNDEMSEVAPYAENDWWGYCSNKGCVNHGGESWGQSGLDFAFHESEEEEN